MKVYINAKIITMDGEKVIPNGVPTGGRQQDHCRADYGRV